MNDTYEKHIQGSVLSLNEVGHNKSVVDGKVFWFPIGGAVSNTKVHFTETRSLV